MNEYQIILFSYSVFFKLDLISESITKSITSVNESFDSYYDCKRNSQIIRCKNKPKDSKVYGYKFILI